MRVRGEDVDPSLRMRGRIARLLSPPNRSEADLRRPPRFGGLMRHLPGPRGLRVEERWIERGDGSRLRVKVYRAAGPVTADRMPGILWIHGGGYVLGSPEEDRSTYRRLVEATGGVIVAPAYRLGPEASYPAALDDCALALRWMRDMAPARAGRAVGVAPASRRDVVRTPAGGERLTAGTFSGPGPCVCVSGPGRACACACQCHRMSARCTQSRVVAGVAAASTPPHAGRRGQPRQTPTT